MDPLIVVFGLGVGVLVGLTGIGGGSLMTPLLILAAGINPVVAIGTDLAYGAITKTVGGWRHLRSGTVDLGVSKWLAVGSVPGSIIGVIVVDMLHERYGDSFEGWLLGFVAIALLIVSLSVLFRAVFMVSAAERERHTVPLTKRVRLGSVGIGFSLGFTIGMTSVGSGALIGLALIMLYKLTPHRVVGTDVFHAAILLWSAGIAHWIGGNVDFGLMGTILLGSVPGVWIGSHLIHKVPADGLRPALGCVLLGSALGVATKAGADLPVWTIVGLPALAGGVAWLVHRNRPSAPTGASPVAEAMV